MKVNKLQVINSFFFSTVSTNGRVKWERSDEVTGGAAASELWSLGLEKTFLKDKHNHLLYTLKFLLPLSLSRISWNFRAFGFLRMLIHKWAAHLIKQRMNGLGPRKKKELYKKEKENTHHSAHPRVKLPCCPC